MAGMLAFNNASVNAIMLDCNNPCTCGANACDCVNEELGGPVCDISSQTGPPLRLQWETGSRVIHLYDPPEPVSISMRSIDPVIGQSDYSSSPTHPSLRVRAAGIRVEPVVDGYLLTAVRLSDGQWRAIVHIELRSANGRTGIQVPVWVQPEAVRRKEDL